VGDYLIEQILLAASDAKSIVAGESFPKLSKSYRQYKESEGLGGKPNLTFEGDLLDALKRRYGDDEDAIKIGWFGKQAGKADGHANLSGDSPIPTRRTIPGEGQSFKPSIRKEIERIIADAIKDEEA